MFRDERLLVSLEVFSRNDTLEAEAMIHYSMLPMLAIMENGEDRVKQNE